MQTEQGAAQIIQVDRLTVTVADLPHNRQSFLIQLGGGLVIATQPGALAQVAVHSARVAAVTQFLAQGQCLMKVSVSLLEMAEVKMRDAIKLKAVDHASPLAALLAKCYCLFGHVQNGRRFPQAVKPPPFEIKRLDSFLQPGVACFTSQYFRSLGTLH